MPTLIEGPTVIAAAVNKPKTIEEYAGRINSSHTGVSVAAWYHRRDGGSPDTVHRDHE